MTDPIDHFAEAVSAIHDPTARLAEAVSAIFSDAAKRPGGNQELHLRLLDGVERGRALRARMEARYDTPAMYDRLQSRGGMSALWC
jgi:hypothetical protein